MKFFAIHLQGYSLIHDGFCDHKDGGQPTHCHRNAVYSRLACESSCTSHEPCIAYHYNVKSNSECYLITSVNRCPVGFYLYIGYNTAQTIDDLSERYSKSFVCYGRESSRTTTSQMTTSTTTATTSKIATTTKIATTKTFRKSKSKFKLL